MSLVLYNGMQVPDIPENYLAEYPYAVIMIETTEDGPAAAIIGCSSPVSVLYDAESHTGKVVSPTSSTWALGMYIDTETTPNGWELIGTGIQGPVDLPLGESSDFIYTLAWSNHDIKLAENYNEEDGSYTLGDTFYPAHGSVPTIVLSNGSEILGIPSIDDITSVYPNYSIVHYKLLGQELFIVIFSDVEFVCVPKDLYEESNDYIVYDYVLYIKEGHHALVMYDVVTHTWDFSNVEVNTESTEFPLGYMISGDILYLSMDLQYTNHDIMIATDVSEDGTYILGDEIYMENMAGPKPPKNVVLPDGTELPPYPDGYLDTYKYSMIFKEDSQSSNTYYLVSYPSELYKIAPNTLTNTYEALTCLTAGYQVWSVTVGDEGWVSLPARRDVGKFLSSDIIDAPIEVSLNNGSVVDWTTGWYTLPDGTDVPPIPDDVFTNHPYRLVLRSIDLSTNKEIYVMSESSDELVFDNDALVIEDGVSHKAWQCDANELSLWTARDDNESLPISDIIWVNYDIMNASDSSSVYRMSDVNYRAYEGWAKSIGDEIRRLSESVDDLTPKKMEETLRSLESPLIDCETEVY